MIKRQRLQFALPFKMIIHSAADPRRSGDASPISVRKCCRLTDFCIC